MDHNPLIQALNTSPSVRLLRMSNAEFFIQFVTKVFAEQRSIGQEKLFMLLEALLDDQDENSITDNEIGINSFGESNEAKAKRYIKDWTSKGLFANYQDADGEVIYELSSYTSKTLDWLESLKKEDYIGTESKFKNLFALLKELVEYSNEDREKRLDLLRKKKLEIEHQIERLEMGEDIEVFEDFQIEPRYHSLNKLAKEFLSDFNEVDDNFKDIIRQIYKRQSDNEQKKDLLTYFFDALAELKSSQQGKSFYAFWEFIISPDLQNEWDELTDSLYGILEKRNIKPQDMFLKNIKKHLLFSSNRVVATNNRMSEKLSQIIRQNAQSDTKATKQVIMDIKKSLLEGAINKENLDASLEYEELAINLPLEFQLTMTTKKEFEYNKIPIQSVQNLADMESLGNLIKHRHTDLNVLRSRIDKALDSFGQTTIAEVIEENNGLQNGLDELFGYLGLKKEYNTVESNERKQNIAFSDDKCIAIPEIIITRKL